MCIDSTWYLQCVVGDKVQMFPGLQHFMYLNHI